MLLEEHFCVFGRGFLLLLVWESRGNGADGKQHRRQASRQKIKRLLFLS